MYVVAAIVFGIEVVLCLWFYKNYFIKIFLFKINLKNIYLIKIVIEIEGK